MATATVTVTKFSTTIPTVVWETFTKTALDPHVNRLLTAAFAAFETGGVACPKCPPHPECAGQATTAQWAVMFVVLWVLGAASAYASIFIARWLFPAGAGGARGGDGGGDMGGDGGAGGAGGGDGGRTTGSIFRGAKQAAEDAADAVRKRVKNVVGHGEEEDESNV